MHFDEIPDARSAQADSGAQNFVVRYIGQYFTLDAGSAVKYPARYGLLDGVRGLAALAVVLTHHGLEFLGHDAVLMFFIVSGYCIASSAYKSISVGHTGNTGLYRFIWRRLKRIYPPYALSLIFFAITRILRDHFTKGSPVQWDPLVWLQSFTLTQWTHLISHPASSPTDNASLLVTAHWSLNYEEQFYLIVAFCLWASGDSLKKLPVFFATLTVISLCWLGVFGSDTFHGVFFEYWPHFAIGAGLFFILCATSIRALRTVFFLALVYLTLRAVGSELGLLPHTSSRLINDFTVLGLAGIILMLARPLSERITDHILWLPLSALGTISYSLYLIHQFNITLSNAGASLLTGKHAPFAIHTTMAILIQIALAIIFWYLCERPFTGTANDGRQPTATIAG